MISKTTERQTANAAHRQPQLLNSAEPNRGQDHLDDRIRFHRIDKKTGEVLKANKAFILASISEILDDFYRHVVDFAQTRAFFRNEDHIQYAKGMQVRHWGVILDGTFGPEYVKSVENIGEVHNRIGLEPTWYIGGYNFLLCALLDRAGKKDGRSFALGGRRPDTELQQSLTKAVLLDMDLAIGVYIDAGRRDRIRTISDLSDRFETSVATIVSEVDESARGLNRTAEQMQCLCHEVLQQSSTVSAASDDTSLNLQTVAAASEELVASIGEISRQVDEAARISDEAVRDSESTVARIEELNQSMGGIGEVIQIINGIASQTNLLALNATIEAARAGEQGKGFAVVATEVKSLANETAKATQTISAQIAHLQSTTVEAVESITRITGVIGSLHSVAASIAGAVDQQSAATHEISSRIQQVSQSVISVSRNIGDVARSVNESMSSTAYALESSQTLTQQAARMKSEVNDYLTHARSL